MATATIEVEVDVDLSEFEDDVIIEELAERGYSIIGEQGNLDEIIETDIRGCEIKANGEVYQFTGMIKIIVERD